MSYKSNEHHYPPLHKKYLRLAVVFISSPACSPLKASICKYFSFPTHKPVLSSHPSTILPAYKFLSSSLKH